MRWVILLNRLGQNLPGERAAVVESSQSLGVNPHAFQGGEYLGRVPHLRGGFRAYKRRRGGL